MDKLIKISDDELNEILANHKFPEITEIPPNEPKKPEEPSSFSFKIFRVVL